MITGNCMRTVCNYASNTPYCSCPNDEQIEKGVIPLDSLPADWWNWMWNDTNGAINEAKTNFNSVISELVTVLCCAGITPQGTCVDQLYRAVNQLRQTLATSEIAGAVKSSSTCGNICVSSTGIMTANGLGNVTNLTTGTKTNVVAAINELKSTYDSCFSTVTGNLSTLTNGKAPNNHASTATTYGVGNGACYGHLKISDTYTSCVGNAAAGMAASQSALYDVYNKFSKCPTAATTLGNVAGKALGTADAGTAGTAARSDHVHPHDSLIATNKECLLLTPNNNIIHRIDTSQYSKFTSFNYTGGSPGIRVYNGNCSLGYVCTACFYGDVKGNVTGNVTGNLTGNVTGNVTGNLTGIASCASKLLADDTCSYACIYGNNLVISPQTPYAPIIISSANASCDFQFLSCSSCPAALYVGRLTTRCLACFNCNICVSGSICASGYVKGRIFTYDSCLCRLCGTSATTGVYKNLSPWLGLFILNSCCCPSSVMLMPSGACKVLQDDLVCKPYMIPLY